MGHDPLLLCLGTLEVVDLGVHDGLNVALGLYYLLPLHGAAFWLAISPQYGLDFCCSWVVPLEALSTLPLVVMPIHLGCGLEGLLKDYLMVFLVSEVLAFCWTLLLKTLSLKNGNSCPEIQCHHLILGDFSNWP